MGGKLGVALKCILWAYLVCMHSAERAVAMGEEMSHVTTGGLRPTDTPRPTEGHAGAGSGGFNVVQSAGKRKFITFMDTDVVTSFNYSVVCQNRSTTFVLTAATQDPSVLRVAQEILISCETAVVRKEEVPSRRNTENPSLLQTGEFRVNLYGGIIGMGAIEFTLYDGNYTENSVTYTIPERKDANDVTSDVISNVRVVRYEVLVLKKRRPVDVIFRVVLYCVLVLVMMGFGVKLDLGVVRENLRRPVAPVIGLSCQYIIMPLIAFTVAKLVTVGDFAVSFGIFVAGCCPGGGGSNMYSFLLNGELTLSITMTALSTIAALGMMPLLIYTLGSTLMDGREDINIPFINVVMSLSLLIVPLFFGLLLQHKLPTVAGVIKKLLKPVTITTMVIVVTVGFYSNAFIFRLFKPKVIIAGCMLPYFGYILGGLVAVISRRDWKTIKTIAIETGMQNTSIAYILLISSFPPPIGDLAAVAPIASALMTLIPPFFITIIYLIYGKCTKKTERDIQHEEKNGDVKTKLTVGDSAGIEKSEKTTVI